MIRPMQAKDESAVRALTALGHPDWPVLSRGWYRGEHRSFVAVEDGHIVGYTTYGMTPDLKAYGRDVVVHPDWRGKGIGGLLHGARLQEAKARGATHFVGMTQERNTPMVRILEAWGALKTITTADGTAYVNGWEV